MSKKEITTTDRDELNEEMSESKIDPLIDEKLNSLQLSLITKDDEEYFNHSTSEAYSQETLKKSFAHLDELNLSLIPTEKKPIKIEEEPTSSKSNNDEMETSIDEKKKPFFQRKLTNNEVIKVVAGIIIILIVIRYLI